MRLPVAMSTAAMSGPGVTRPALSQLVATHTSRSRSIWRCARSHHANREKIEQITRRVDKYHRHPQANIRRKAEGRHDWPSTTHRDPSASWGWGLWRSRSSFSDFSAGRGKSFWDAERDQMQQRMEHLKKHIAEDPYGAIFGRRLDPFYRTEKSNDTWPGFLRSSMNAGPAPTVHPSKAYLQDFNFTKSPQNSTLGNPDALQYDPISGRMVPKPPKPSGTQNVMEGYHAGVDCPPGSEVEAKFVSNPTLVGDGQFQPGSIPAANLANSDAKLNSQSIDCPPGSELEALFTSDPDSFKNAQVMAKAPHGQGVAQKPNVNVACPPGNELEALFISESTRTEQPGAEILKVQGSAKKLDADAGLSSGANVECPPGSELEAMFISEPATREDYTRPLEAFDAQSTGKQTNAIVDCPPGNELDAKFAAESAGFGPQTDGFNQSAISGAEAGSRPSIDCSPGSELEAKILAESTSRSTEDSKAGTTVDCPPGSELEAKFVTDPASAEDGQFQPAMVSDQAATKKADINIDCAPGSELESLFISDAATAETRGASDDLGALSASDIRARYASLLDVDTDPQLQKSWPSKNLEFDGSEDRVGDFLMQNQKLATASGHSVAGEQWSSADYRILAYDPSVSKITTSEADSFFGTSETTQPHEVLSRLHNPAKFVPYFAQMQQDGYDIVTGGGDILVFRRSPNAPKHTISQTAVAEQDSVNPMTHAEIAKYVRHDSYDPTDSLATSNRSTANQPPSGASASGPFSYNGETSSPKSESSIRKAFRRMIFAGTATAATCYAIGVVTEYFRTGGQDGRGIDGFTSFESERRRWE